MSLTISTSVSAITSLTNQGFVDIFNTGFTCFGVTLNIQQLFATNTNHLLTYWFKLDSSKSILPTD